MTKLPINLSEAVQVSETERQYYYLKKVSEHVKALGEALGRTPTYWVTTFGCQMNARDSEKLSGMLSECGFAEGMSEDEADLVLFNTCTVRENANTRLYGRLGHMRHLKKLEPHKIVGLCGCMMQEPEVIETLKKSYRFVNLVFGTHNIFKFPELLANCMESDRMVIDIWKDTDQIVEDLPNKRKFFFKSGVNIMFGCNNFCSYCIVPYVRGRERSRDAKEILRECERLAADGVKEVMLLGQNVNSYGNTLEDSISFAELLAEVEKIDGIERIRFMTSHPKDLSDELIEVMKNSKKICRHIHLPVQAGSDRILKRMNRRYTKEQYLSLVDRIRTAMPDISLTTDIIVGFPGESEEDFRETLDVVRKVRYDSAFTFIYSKRTGTPAVAYEDQVPKDIVKDRFDRLLAEVQQIAGEVCCRFEGRVMPVLVEHINEQDASLVTGRISNNLVVHFPGDESMIGEIIDVRLDECKGFYYLGTPVSSNV